MKTRSLVVTILTAVILIGGCGQSSKIARQAYDRGTEQESQIRAAMFTKAWGLNRALITEARQKWLDEAKIEIFKAGQAGTISPDKAVEIVAKFETELGKDEAVSSENFAYLAYMLVLADRTDEMLGNVDFYLESQKPIWQQFSAEAKGSARDAMSEIESWKPLIKDIEKALPTQLLDGLKTMSGAAIGAAVSGP
jgi:hypothetical protein